MSNSCIRLRNFFKFSIYSIAPWDACNSFPCRNGATCIDVNVDTFVCMCRDGFFGIQCEQGKCYFRSLSSTLREEHSLLNGCLWEILLPPATKLGQGNIFRSVCQEFCPRGVVSQHALQVVSQHALKQVSWGGGIPACLAGFQAQTQRASWAVWPGGSLGPDPRGKLWGLDWGVSRPIPRGVSRPTPRGLCVCPSIHWGRPPSPQRLLLLLAIDRKKFTEL